MKVLTLSQPWATLIAIGEKSIDTKAWTTEYRGPLLIHARSRFPKAFADRCREPLFAAALAKVKRLHFGALIGRVNLVDCLCTSDRAGGLSPWVAALDHRELAFGNFSPARFGWMLQEPRAFKFPIPALERPGCDLMLWEYPDEQLPEVYR